MSSFKLNRVSEDIKREISAIMRELKDPRISDMISIVKADVSGDLSYAKIYVSSLEGFESSKRSVEGLKSATGYIRRELSNRLKLKKAPELKFIADDSIAHSSDINKILSELLPENKDNNA